ncbi:MAG: hypothetical protein A4E30_00875 [Methanomassiliicoccales archaeon PtaB.Bin215]|nr:MAG: hypothetical protein A4E30_00875 [Methanomassiliicoccales archaeon PtaB.Bin215]
MFLYVAGVPRSENRMVTWCMDSGVSERKSQNMLGSLRLVAGFLFWVCMKSGNLMASRMKNTGVLLPTMS